MDEASNSARYAFELESESGLSYYLQTEATDAGSCQERVMGKG